MNMPGRTIQINRQRRTQGCSLSVTILLSLIVAMSILSVSLLSTTLHQLFDKNDDSDLEAQHFDYDTPSPTTATEIVTETETETETDKVTSTLTVQKLIQPGNHINIPHPSEIIGPNGETNYVHNPKVLIQNPPPFQIPNDEYKNQTCSPPGYGDEFQSGYRNILKIRNHIESSQTTNRRNVSLFCAIYTYHKRIEQTNIIRQTWGPKCDGILFASDVTNTTTDHFLLPSNSRVGFRYDSIYQRIRSIFAYLYDNFLEEYDYFHFCGDDTFLIVENLKEFLASDRVKEWDEVEDQYLFAGFWIHWWDFFPDGEFYLSGGAGYTVSRKALKAYVEGPMRKCKVDMDASIEDIEFMRCIREFLTSKFIDTRDDEGAHRYHEMNITQHSDWPSKINWGARMNKVISQSLHHMEEQFGFPFVVRDAYISKSSVAFHYHPMHNLRRMDILLYRDLETECGETYKALASQLLLNNETEK